MLIISREVPIKLANHAWNVRTHEAFGFLLGNAQAEEIVTVLPCSKAQECHDYCGEIPSDRWNGLAENFDKAALVGKLFDLEVVGFYATYESQGCKDEYPMPEWLNLTSLKIVILYETICCRSCSGYSLIYNGKKLRRFEGYNIAPGIRLRNTTNQKRILKEWRKVFGSVDCTRKPYPF